MGLPRLPWQGPVTGQPDLQHILRHLGLVIKMTGGWPIRRVRQGYAAVPLWSSEALLRLVWSATLAVYTMHLIIDVTRGFSTSNFVTRVSKVMHWALESWLLTVPFVHWPSAPGLARHFNSWRRFQMLWFRVTGSRLEDILIRELTVTVFAVATVVGSAATITAQVLLAPDDMKTTSGLLYVINSVGLVGEMLFWCIVTYQVYSIQRCMRQYFLQELDSRRLTAEVLQEYSLLWMRLRALLLELVSAWEPVWLRWLALVTGANVVTLFYGYTSIATRYYPGAVFSLYIGFNTYLYLFIMSAFGNIAELEVSRGLKVELLGLSLPQLDRECRHQVFHFLRIMTNSPTKIVLKGAFPINNSMPFSFTNKAVTYMAVLAQFAILAGSDDATHNM